MTGGVDGGEGLCGDTAEVLVRESQSLEIFCEESVKAVSEWSDWDRGRQRW